MLKIRLQRVGRKNDPSFRVVVLESTEGPKSGNHVDEIGFYNAVTKQKSMDTEKAKLWLSRGAQPSDTVFNMFVTEGVIESKKRNVLPRKKPIPKETSAAATEALADNPAEEAGLSSEAPAKREEALSEGPAEAMEANEASETVPETPTGTVPEEAQKEGALAEAPTEEPTA